jgi:hypothetical protein
MYYLYENKCEIFNDYTLQKNTLSLNLEGWAVQDL